MVILASLWLQAAEPSAWEFVLKEKTPINNYMIQVPEVIFTTDFTDFTDLGCASLLLFHRFFYDYSGQGRDWLRVANNLCNHIFESLNNLCNLELIAALPQKSK